MVNVSLGQHGVVLDFRLLQSLQCKIGKKSERGGEDRKRKKEKITEVTGVLDAMMMSLALPWRRAFMVDLYPRLE